MSAPLPPGSTIGIVGGGQLGRMLSMAAARLGYRTVVLEPQDECPAAQVASRQIVAGYDDGEALQELASCVDVVTYEFENVPVASARLLAARVPVLPSARALEIAQDRLTEKRFLNDIGIATAQFRQISCAEDLAEGLSALGGRGILKTRRLGYDGKGQRVVHSHDDLDLIHAQMSNTPLILEQLIAFEREISVIVARGRHGATAAYDPAENIHQDAILFRSTVPASISVSTGEAACRTATMLVEALDYVGVAGIEFFVLDDGSLLVNEFAPRVHNSGHWTEAACAISQFEQHIRAIVDLPLADSARHSDCVMENLIGNAVLQAPRLLAEPGLVLHLYGKSERRPGRKMGHFTRIAARR